MTQFPEQRLAALLRALPTVPEVWVAAAREIPRAERDLAHPPAGAPGSPAAEQQSTEAPAGRDRGG